MADRENAMRLVEITAIHDASDPTRIALVRLRIAAGGDPQPTEWIEAQIAVDVPTVRNGALLRAEALKQVRDVLGRLSENFERLGRPSP